MVTSGTEDNISQKRKSTGNRYLSLKDYNHPLDKGTVPQKKRGGKVLEESPAERKRLRRRYNWEPYDYEGSIPSIKEYKERGEEKKALEDVKVIPDSYGINLSSVSTKKQVTKCAGEKKERPSNKQRKKILKKTREYAGGSTQITGICGRASGGRREGTEKNGTKRGSKNSH